MTPTRSDLKTFHQWLYEGRAVQAGQRARWYLANQDQTAAVAVFLIDQTSPVAETDLTGFSVVLSQEEWSERRTASHATRRPRLRARVAGDGLAVWCGRNKEAIDIFKRAGWMFDGTIKRWVHPDRDLDRFVPAMQELGFEVIVDA